MAEVCIMCHAERTGEPIADTSVIRAIRSVKERLKMASNNTLVVCPDCIEKLANLPETIAEVLAHDPTFRLVAYCTPDTIRTDLTGGRADSYEQNGKAAPVPLPEVKVLGLGTVGRRDLLHPRLNRMVEDY